MPTRKIDYYLNLSSRLRALTGEARRLAELQQVFQNIAPAPLAHACCVKHLRNGTLVLLAENAAVAAKLKQLTARLLTAYVKQRMEVTAIRVEVQVNEAALQAPPASRQRRLSIESIENLERLAAGLEDSPLKQALTGIAARQRRER